MDMKNNQELPATGRQQAFLEERGLWAEGMTRGRASDLIDMILKS